MLNEQPNEKTKKFADLMMHNQLKYIYSSMNESLIENKRAYYGLKYDM